MIDSYCYKLKEIIYLESRRKRLPISSKDLNYIVEISKDSQGNLRRSHISCECNIKYILEKLALIYKKTWRLGDHSKEWVTFLSSIEIRDRLTHPKIARDLEVSDEDFSRVGSSLGWLLSCFSEVL